MILPFFLILAFGLLVLVSVGILIAGLVKKKRNLLITAALIFVIGTVGGIFSVLAYTKKAIAYVRSSEFQNDTKKGAELIGETVGSTASGISNGLARTLDDEAIKNLAGKSAVIAGKVTKTVASNLDSTLGNKSIFLDETLENSGLELGRAEEKYKDTTNDVEIFIDYKKDFKGLLKLTNYDQNGRKIEIVTKNIHSKSGQSNVETFKFLHSGLGITTYYILSKGA
ncbi:MAG: hypothetical protein INR73_11785 [Williamsia sp.]|nr:hypothetical protein [Williamsia sp.]